MPVGITGHTKGIGLALSQEFCRRGETVIGFSRSNGFDITDSSTMPRMMAACSENQCHTLVLNAQAGFIQTHQLYAIAKAWGEDPTKTIIAISSNASDDTRRNAWMYSIQKLALDAAMDQLHAKVQCRLLNIKPGVVDTEFAHVIQGDFKKLTVDDVVTAVFFAFDQPRHVLIKSITIQPRQNF